MSNHNLEVLLEKSNKVSLGIRSRQSGITLKEYFLNQKERINNIYRSQRAKLNEALEQAYELSKSDKTSNSSISLRITNKAGKVDVRPFAPKGMTSPKIFYNLRKITAEIYSIIKYRCEEMLKLCEQGIKRASAIIKGKASIDDVNATKSIKVDYMEHNGLLNSSLSDMRNAFKAFHSALR